MSSGSVSFESVPEKLPRYPIPVVHLGRLAVDTNFNGQRLGEFLLLDALRRTLLISEQLGIYAVELFALNSTVKSFYLRYGFVEFKDDDRHLFLPLATLKKLRFV